MANFSVVSNIGALNSMNQLIKNQLGLSTTMVRLASGLRINGAKDDAAGLAIAENLRADVASLNQAVRNANDGIGVINVADSALNE
ncbi:MAG: flagellin FliC, partial [Acidobacteria bacterium]|nr:flagellin FliC [Acidobacteriota bacterium]